MSITELIVKVQNLSVEKQAEVFNFVKNLESINDEVKEQLPRKVVLSKFINHPIVVDSFKPLSRDEANEQ
jgi:hypothetical protein